MESAYNPDDLMPGAYPAGWPVPPGDFVWPTWGNTEYINPGLVGLCCVMSVVIVCCPLPLRAGGLREKREIMEAAAAGAAGDLTVEDLAEDLRGSTDTPAPSHTPSM